MRVVIAGGSVSLRVLGWSLLLAAAVFAAAHRGGPEGAATGRAGDVVAGPGAGHAAALCASKSARPARPGIDPSISLRDLALLTRAEFRALADEARPCDDEIESGMRRAIREIGVLRSSGLGPRHPEVQMWAFRLKRIVWPGGITAQDREDGHEAVESVSRVAPRGNPRSAERDVRATAP